MRALKIPYFYYYYYKYSKIESQNIIITNKLKYIN